MMCEGHRNRAEYKKYIQGRFLEPVGIEDYGETDKCKSIVICLVFRVFTIHQVIIKAGKQDRGNEPELKIHKPLSDDKNK